MAEILSKGTKRRYWWVEKTVECEDCGCEFKIQKKDRVRTIPPIKYTRDFYREVRCPNQGCTNWINVHLSD